MVEKAILNKKTGTLHICKSHYEELLKLLSFENEEWSNLYRGISFVPYVDEKLIKEIDSFIENELEFIDATMDMDWYKAHYSIVTRNGYKFKTDDRIQFEIRAKYSFGRDEFRLIRVDNGRYEPIIEDDNPNRFTNFVNEYFWNFEEEYDIILDERFLNHR